MSERVIVCGSRGWTDRKMIADRLRELVIASDPHQPDPVIVHGGARGADTLAGEEAGKAGLLVEEHPAEWQVYGKRGNYPFTGGILALAWRADERSTYSSGEPR